MTTKLHSALTNDPSNGSLHDLHLPGYNVANLSDLNAISTAQDGDLAFRSDTGQYYIFYSSSWKLIAPVNNTAATVAPTVINDNTQGYSVGSLWFNTTSSTLYICIDATTNAAVWDKIPLVSGSENSDNIISISFSAPNTWDCVTAPIIAAGSSSDFDYYADTPTIIQADNNFYVFYAGWDSSTFAANIGLAKGPGLQNLTKQGIVLSPTASAWDAGWLSGPRIFYDNGTYYLYYEGSPNTGYEAPPSSIGVATSTDLTTWTKYSGNPILSPGTAGSWDEHQIFRPFVFKWNNIYYMFYNANNGASLEQIGFATATSPLGPWTKYSGNPVFGPSSTTWATHATADPYLVRIDNNRWGMFYTGDGNMAIAYSSDLISWTDDSSNPFSSSKNITSSGIGNVIIKGEILNFGEDLIMVGTENAIPQESIYIARFNSLKPGSFSIRTQDNGALTQTLMDFRNNSGYGVVLNSVSQNLQGNDLEFIARNYHLGLNTMYPIVTLSPSGMVLFQGGISYPINPQTTTYQATPNDYLILGDATGGAFNVTLSTSTYIPLIGQVLIIKKTDSSANAVTVLPPAGQTIEGGSSVVLASQYDFVKVIFDGTSTWYKL